MEHPHRHAGDTSEARRHRQPGHLHSPDQSWRRRAGAVGKQFIEEARRDHRAWPRYYVLTRAGASSICVAGGRAQLQPERK
eukprot:2556544-Pyramimonas_sp.AAC.1